MNNKEIYKIFSIFLIFFSFTSFFIGFYLDENSAGAGTYSGDFVHTWNNVQVYLNNNFFSSLNHPDFYSGRTPLMYILHELFNPFIETKIGYRRSAFVISLLLPILFYFCLKQKFKDEDKMLLLLISSTVCLSPYFRTSAYWGLEENYGLICILLAFLSLNYLLKEHNNKTYKIYIQIFFVTLFSSCCLYFDYKFTIIPIICFIKIILSKKLFRHKIFSVFCYSIFSLPCIYLIILWGGLVQTRVVAARSFGDELYFSHIGYCATIICFYLLPLLLFKKKNIFNLLKSFFSEKKNYYLISLFFLYLFYLMNYHVFSEQILLEKGYFHAGSALFGEPISIGKGYIHKVSIILFKDNFLRQIFTYSFFLLSWLVILIYTGKSIQDIGIVFYFFILSLLLFPFIQEYLDPVIILMAFTFFNSKLIINYKNSIMLFLYLASFLFVCNIYYMKIHN